MRGRSYKILADVEDARPRNKCRKITDANCSGVIFAHGSRFGGHALFIKDKKLHYVYNFLGIKPTLHVNEQDVAQGPMKTQSGKFTLSGDGLCIGRDSGDAVSEDYKTPGEFKGGHILAVAVTVEKAQHLDLEKLARAALAVD